MQHLSCIMNHVYNYAKAWLPIFARNAPLSGALRCSPWFGHDVHPSCSWDFCGYLKIEVSSLNASRSCWSCGSKRFQSFLSFLPSFLPLVQLSSSRWYWVWVHWSRANRNGFLFLFGKYSLLVLSLSSLSHSLLFFSRRLARHHFFNRLLWDPTRQCLAEDFFLIIIVKLDVFVGLKIKVLSVLVERFQVDNLGDFIVGKGDTARVTIVSAVVTASGSNGRGHWHYFRHDNYIVCC